MEEDILDTTEQPIKHGYLFSILGIVFTILSPIIFAMNIVLIIHFAYGYGNAPINEVNSAIRITSLSLIIGLTLSLISLFRKEQLKFIKTLSILLNTVWMILWVLVIINLGLPINI